MDNIVNFTINLNGNAYTGVAQLDEALGNVLVDVQKTQSWFGSLKDAIGASSIKLDAFIGVVEKVSQAFQSMVGSSLDFEQQQANMRTLLNGDAEATDNLIGKIREYGKATVYDRSGLIEAQKTMMAFGLDAEYAFGKLKNIGDIALGDSQKMQSLALAFSQMSSTGKLMGQDLLQMINAGFNPLEVISQKTGKSIAELKEEMSKGAISAEQVAQAFEWATEEGGRFYQGAETAAQTTAGKIAKVKDQIDDFKISLFEWSHGLTAWIAEMGNMIVPISQAIPMFKVLYNISAATFKHLKALNFAGILGGIGRKATEARISLAFMRKDIETCSMASLGFIRNTVRATMAVGRFATVGLFNAVKGMGAYLLSLITGGAASRTFANVATASFAKFALSAKAACQAVGVAIVNIPIVGWIAAAVAAVIGLVTLLWNKSEGFRRLVFGTWEAVKAAVSNAWQYVKTAAQVTWEVLKRVFTLLRETFSGLWERLKSIFERLKSAVSKAWGRVKPIITAIAEKIRDVVRVVLKVVAVVALVVGAVVALVGWLVKTVWDNLLKPLFQRLFSIVSMVVSSVATAVDNIVGFVTSIPERISNALDNVREFFTRAWDGITGKVRSCIDRITGFVNSIPEKISTALDNVREFFTRVWDSITGKVRNCIDRIVGFVTAIPDRITTTLDKVRTSLTDMWDNIAATVRDDVDRITGFVTSIPEKIPTASDNVREFFARVWESITGKVRNCIDRITGFVTSIPERISSALEGVREFFARVWESITGKVHSCIERIAGFVKSIPRRISTALDNVRTFFADQWYIITTTVHSYIDRIIGFTTSIPERISTALKNVRTFFADQWYIITTTVHSYIDRIIGFATSIPERISTALDNVREFFARVWDSITGKVRNCIDRITGFVTSIPERISTALENVREFFARVWDSITGKVHSCIDSITGFVKSIPERISTALDNVREFFARVWDSITGKVRSCIDRIKELVEELRTFVTETFAKAGDFIAGVWRRVRESVGVAVDWIADKLGRIAGWVKTKMVDPIRNAFTGMWNVIRDVFDKILTKLGKLFAPIRELWNKLFPKDKMKDVKLAYAAGTDKGTKSWEKSKNKGDVDTGKETMVLDGKDGLDGLAGVNGKSGKDGKTKKELSEGTIGKNAGTVAGKAQQITIKLENMVGTMNFNGGLRDNASNVESTLAEMMARILGMAETAA